MNCASIEGAEAANWRAVLIPYAISRCGILCAGVLAIMLGEVHPGWRISPNPWVDMWARWDSRFYVNIAARGYEYIEGQQSSVAFFPLYPMLMRLLTLGSHDPVALAIAGWLIANVATALGAIYMYKLVVLDESQHVARRAIWCMLFFPTSFFFSMVYTEGLFFLLTVTAFYCARRQRWMAAGFLGGLSAATRTLGVLLILPLACEWWTQRPRSSWRSGVCLFLVPCGLGAYMWYVHAQFGDPLVFAKAHANWGRVISLTGACQRVTELVTDPTFANRLVRASVDLAFVIVGGVLLIGLLRRTRVSYLLYSTYAIGVPLATLQTLSVPRFLIVAFPLFVVLAKCLRPRALFYAVLILFGALQLVFVARWGLSIWVA